MKQLRNFKKGANGNIKNSGDPVFDEAMKKYGGLEEDALISKLLESVRVQRANGTYNPEQMNSYVQMLRPHLNREQLEKLQNVIKIINSENV